MQARVRLAPVLHFLGIILCCLAALMMIPATVDLAYEHPDSATFVGAAMVTSFVGVTLTLAFSARPSGLACAAA